ncbi:ATP-binding protein [Hydrogenophaga bisanensis]|uniref:histidine kinase n=1 Tax=Hydrogenophaga bisanensis TaxID=439611 RepID=A0ABW2R956_9BURK
MHSAPLPDTEAQRLAKLHSYGVLDTLPQTAFNDIVALASSICGTPVALISLIDRDRQWFKAKTGIDVEQTGRDIAFCAHAILQPQQVMVVEDARQDERFRDNPLLEGELGLRFYAGAPIVTDDGHALGTVCVIDTQPRQLSPAAEESLRILSRLVVNLLEHEKERHAEEARQREEARRARDVLMAMAVSTLDLIAYIDRDERYQAVNQTWLTYWGCDESKVIGMHVRDRVGPAVYENEIAPLIRRALSGELVRYQHLVRFHARGPRFMEISLMPDTDASGTVRGLILRSHDIHLQHEREQELKEALSALEQRTLEQQRFIQVLSHDLREPVNAVRNFSTLLTTDHLQELSAPAQRYLGFVTKGGERMSRMLDDLTDLLQLDGYTPKVVDMDTRALVSQVMEELHEAIEQSGALITTSPLDTLRADPALLRIVLFNYIGNALKFRHQDRPPQIHIETVPVDDGMELSVTDHGLGIPEDQQAGIFDMFRRLHTRQRFDGAGLGLSLCRRIAQLHGGRVTLHSTLGRGSRFGIVLPPTVPGEPA